MAKSIQESQANTLARWQKMTPEQRQAEQQKGEDFLKELLGEKGKPVLTPNVTEPTQGERDRGVEATEFFSGAGGVKSGIQDYFDLARDYYPDTDLSYLEDVFKAPGGVYDDLDNKQNFRDTLVSQGESAQRNVRAVNEAVFTGRKRRRGSNVSLPKIALAGLNKNVQRT